MNTLFDPIISDLEVMRDNYNAWGRGYEEIIFPVRQLIPANVNHAQEIDARTADDLRKLNNAIARFRQCTVEYSVNKYRPQNSEDYTRRRSQMVETARDLRWIMGHIDPALDPR